LKGPLKISVHDLILYHCNGQVELSNNFKNDE
jgi:hypothetical protein